MSVKRILIRFFERQVDLLRLLCFALLYQNSNAFFSLLLVYLNGNNVAEGENNIKYASSYFMN